ncbi:MAG: hypothetical protein IKD66_05760 [Solobacterium sp.]|nr:hypothetical protein [Solobacterium sp.]
MTKRIIHIIPTIPRFGVLSIEEKNGIVDITESDGRVSSFPTNQIFSVEVHKEKNDVFGALGSVCFILAVTIIVFALYTLFSQHNRIWSLIFIVFAFNLVYVGLDFTEISRLHVLTINGTDSFNFITRDAEKAEQAKDVLLEMSRNTRHNYKWLI